MEKYIKWVSAILTSVFSYLYGGIDGLLTALMCCVVLDYVTGVIVAVIEKELSSEIGFHGILKKVLIFIMVALAQITENATGIEGIRGLVIGFYIANEGISILENIAKTVIPLPQRLIDVLKQLRGEDEKIGGSD